jgi:hypothetical protein
VIIVCGLGLRLGDPWDDNGRVAAGVEGGGAALGELAVANSSRRLAASGGTWWFLGSGKDPGPHDRYLVRHAYAVLE